MVIEAMQPEEFSAVRALLRDSGLPEEGLAAHQARIVVARDGAGVQGSAALELYGEAALLRSVAVVPARRGQGWGQRLTQAALDLARRQGVRQVYLLTETAGQFFPRLGFVPTSRSLVPPAVQQSVEFTTLCPDSALVMITDLSR